MFLEGLQEKQNTCQLNYGFKNFPFPKRTDVCPFQSFPFNSMAVISSMGYFQSRTNGSIAEYDWVGHTSIDLGNTELVMDLFLSPTKTYSFFIHICWYLMDCEVWKEKAGQEQTCWYKQIHYFILYRAILTSNQTTLISTSFCQGRFWLAFSQWNMKFHSCFLFIIEIRPFMNINFWLPSLWFIKSSNVSK